MTNQPFLYDPQANVLRQRADMEKPEWNPEIWDVREDYNYAVDQYNAHLAALPAYTPVSGWVPEVGREYYEGKDFQVQNKDENDRCPECGHEEYEDEGFLGKGFRVCAICHQEWWLDVKYNSIYSKLAVPIEQKQEIFTIDDLARLYIEELRGKQQLQPGYPLSFTDHRKWLVSFFNEAKALNKLFTIEDMMKAYDAGCGDVNGTEKEKYFKSFGI